MAVRDDITDGNAAKLATKISEISKLIGTIEKTGFNATHNYRYAKAADVVAAVSELMTRHNVAIFPSIVPESMKVTPAGREGKTLLTTVVAEFTVMDGDTGYERKLYFPGSGSDSLDKGAYKAMTGAQKYFLEKLFNIVVDDPEADPEFEEGESGAAPRAAAPNRELTQAERVAEVKRRQQENAARMEAPRQGEKATQPAAPVQPAAAPTAAPTAQPVEPAPAAPAAAAEPDAAEPSPAPASNGPSRVLHHTANRQAPASVPAKTAPAAAPAEAAPALSTIVDDITIKRQGTNAQGDWHLYGVKFRDAVRASNGRPTKEATTQDEDLALKLQTSKDSGAPVRVTIEPGRAAGTYTIKAVESAPAS